MAEISFTGFVENWSKDSALHPAWGMKTSEPHRKKDGDQWVTVGRTYRTVKSAYGVEIDFTQFAPGMRVQVVGKEKTVTREYNGKTFYDLTVDAESVIAVDGGGSAANLSSFGAREVDPDAPF